MYMVLLKEYCIKNRECVQVAQPSTVDVDGTCHFGLSVQGLSVRLLLPPTKKTKAKLIYFDDDVER